MTEKENLERCRCVDALIRDIRERISKTERDIEELSSRTVVDTVRGGDGGTQLFKVEGLPQSVIEKKRILLEARVNKLGRTLSEKEQAINRAYIFLDTVKPAELRLMLQFYYIDGMSWSRVARKMEKETGKEFSKAGCQIRCMRFFEKLKGEEK